MVIKSYKNVLLPVVLNSLEENILNVWIYPPMCTCFILTYRLVRPIDPSI